MIVCFAVLVLGLYSVILLRRTGQTENPWRPTTEIVQQGAYRFTRNPMYLQMVLGCVGFANILRNTWILLLTPVAAWVLQVFAIQPEEAYLERKFGEELPIIQRPRSSLDLDRAHGQGLSPALRRAPLQNASLT